MDYDNVKKVSDVGQAVKSRFVEIYILPLFNSKPKKNLLFWFNQAHKAWRLSVNKKDLQNVKFVEYLCEELAKTAESELLEVFAPVLEAEYDTGVRTAQAEENLWHSKVSTDIERVFSDQIRLYKVLFENEFRLWSTVPYLFACKNHGIKNGVKDLKAVYNIGASEKFHALKSIVIALPRGNLNDLVAGFDNQIRNAGEGHDRWEITDKDTLLLPNIDSQTGAEKKKTELTKQQMEDYLRQCRKTIWILQTGCLVFLENNPSFEAKLQGQKFFKTREIQAGLEAYAENRLLEIKKFELSEERTSLKLAVKYTPQVVGTSGQIFFGNGDKYEIVNRVSKVRYHYQMLDVVKYVLLHLDKNNLPSVSVEMFDEKDQNLGTVEYEPSEIGKLLIEEGEFQIPKPSKGQMPDKECQIVSQIRVPFGERDYYEKLIREKYPDQND